MENLDRRHVGQQRGWKEVEIEEKVIDWFLINYIDRSHTQLSSSHVNRGGGFILVGNIFHTNLQVKIRRVSS
jgi:hypothetical protein